MLLTALKLKYATKEHSLFKNTILMELTIYLVFTCMHARQYVNIRLGDFSSGTQLLRMIHTHSNTHISMGNKQCLLLLSNTCAALKRSV